MKRLRAIVVNLALVAVSAILVVVFVSVCDRVAGAYLSRATLSRHVGLLFYPGGEECFAMHDYTSCEKINSLGIRDREMSVEKTGAFRIAAIGDSFTYGWGVNLEDTWCKRLEKNLRDQGMDVEVVNLGKPAAGPCEYASIAELTLPILHPDLLIVCILNGDDLQQAAWLTGMQSAHFPNLVRLVWFVKNLRAFEHPPQPIKRDAEQSRAAYVDVANELFGRMDAEQHKRFDALEPAVKEAFFNGTLNPWLIGHTTGNPDYFMNTVNLDELSAQIRGMAAQLRRVRKAAERQHVPVMVFSVPEGFYVNREAYANVQRIGFKTVPEMLTTPVVDQAIEIACRKAGLPFYCVTDQMREHADEPGLYFELDRHLTPAGNALYANLIAPLVVKQIGDRVKPAR